MSFVLLPLGRRLVPAGRHRGRLASFLDRRTRMFEFQLFDSTNHPNPLHLWFGIIQDLAQVHKRLLVSAIRLPTTAFSRSYTHRCREAFSESAEKAYASPTLFMHKT